jgi:hypothetical protein
MFFNYIDKGLLFFLIFFIIVSTHACQDNGLKSDALGGVGEILVMCDATTWQGEIGRSFRKVCSSEQFGLPQPEPYFKLIPVQDLGSNKFQKRHRLILNLRLGANYEGLPNEVALAAQKVLGRGKVYWGSSANPRAFPQREVYLIAKDSADLHGFLIQNGPRVRRQFLIWDKALILDRLSRLTSSDTVMALIRDTVGIQIPHLPGDYRIKLLRPNRVWLSKEIPQGSMNLFVWRDVISKGSGGSSSALSINLIQVARDSVLASGIPGPSPGSHYRTEMLIQPLWSEQNSGLEGRGLWKMEGDFMGGPFVHRAWISHGFSYHAEAFVYCPNESKRAWLRELEALLSSIVETDSLNS